MAIVGIDLGTTNSLVAVMTPDGPETIPNELGDHLTPSAVAVSEDGSLLVGRPAKDRVVADPSSGRAFFKRDMGTDVSYRFGGRAWSPVECSAAILAEMKRIASMHLGAPVESAVVTVPAYFHDTQRQATIAAAGIAGLAVERILNEPTAAALAYGYREPTVERRLLVVDLGGGTLDVTVLEVFDGIIEVRASGGDSRLGGEDYTDALLGLALAQAGVSPAPAERARLRQRVEVAKRTLSDEPSVDLELGGKVTVLSREAFEREAAPITARVRPIVRRALRDAGLVAGDLDDVLLVGGASRMPLVLALIGEELSRIGNRSLDPDRVVALGAAVQGARCAREEGVRDLILTDVCPHSLGVEVSKVFDDGRPEPGYFLPLLDRNVTVPISRVVRISTLSPMQDVLDIRAYQGESRRTEENTLLGSMKVKGMRHRPGQKDPGDVDVRFTYDANGILEVEVTVLHSGVKLAKVIESRPGSLTPAQVADAVERLRPVKTRLRDLLPNRARLERAHRLYVELNGSPRRALEARIEQFESALESGDLDRVGMTAALLDEVLAHHYRDEGEVRRPAPPPAPPSDAPGGPGGGV